MQTRLFKFSHASVNYHFDSRFAFLKKICDPKMTVLLTDEKVYNAHLPKFKGWNAIMVPSGEENKVQATVDTIIEKLIQVEANRGTTLVGVGGGVITDLTGYVASIYMRGIRFGFVPTTLLALVDASIGGKNGIDVGVYKNMVGVIKQPSFILQDASLLQTLPDKEWENGFAEVIKHACIKDASMFVELEKYTLQKWKGSRKMLTDLVARNALLKTKLVQKDEFEKGDRRLLNFGHTLGHALENQYELMHGHAVSIGMTYASHISSIITGFKEPERIVKVLEKYNLPTYASFDKQLVFDVLKMDKKRVNGEINYILLKKIGQGTVQPISLSQLEKIINAL